MWFSLCLGNGKRGSGKIQRSCMEDVNRKRKKRKERDWFPASSELLEIGEVVKEIREASEKGELNGLVLMVIWNSPDLARRDD
ncbi:hypothetical protein CMV_023702 [Castanea mollissima]|uniref:Uncharacterized protein n=1 Tax=Castanea mollissima TaxID=60419 RepID=A0A8J4V6L2_9ROSI|nr:hypothetical protein CMV_023702 [Castanea mollissima]